MICHMSITSLFKNRKLEISGALRGLSGVTVTHKKLFIISECLKQLNNSFEKYFSTAREMWLKDYE